MAPSLVCDLSPRRAQSTQSFNTVQQLFGLSDAFAFSVCSAVKFKDLAISLENSTVPRVTKNYQLTIPKEIRNEILIEAGDEIEMVVNEKKEVIICKMLNIMKGYWVLFNLFF
ncbi:MAG TPA: hypothetical protein C5S37_05835 [Methanophagales archaeon]|nr:hypothetical protein [Methanophagales archaeon]